MPSLPLQAQTAFSDLKRLLSEIEAGGIYGTLREAKSGGRIYAYDQLTIARKPVQRYLGPASDEIRERAAHSKALQRAAADLVRLLRAQGCLAPDRDTGAVLLGFARAGVFRSGGVLVGTHAFRAYEAELGVRLSDGAVTQDVDVAIPKAIRVASTEPPAIKVLRDMGYVPSPSALDADARPWRWTKNANLVEFLTPDTGAPGQIEKLGIHAQQVKFMEYLLDDPIRAPVLYQGGVLVNVPDPARFAVHKLVLVSRRGRDDREKSVKDLIQARTLIDLLAEDRPDDIAAAYEDARNRGPSWRAALDATLKRAKDLAEILSALSAE